MRLFALGTLAKQEIGSALRLRGTVLAWQAVAGLSGLCILIIGVISLHRFIGERYTSYWADAAIAGLFLVIAIIALIAASTLQKRARRREHLKTTMLAAASVASEALPDRNSALQALIIAAIAGGFWFGRKR